MSVALRDLQSQIFFKLQVSGEKILYSDNTLCSYPNNAVIIFHWEVINDVILFHTDTYVQEQWRLFL